MADRPDDLRAADSDREYVAERLRDALSEGRIDLAEYDERLATAYAAKTYGDLKGLLADLPTTVPAERSAVTPFQSKDPAVAVDYSGATSRWLAKQWSGWITTAMILIAIWALTGAHGDFWPKWPLGIWGAVMVATTINGLMNNAPKRDVDREIRRRAEREQRRAERRDERREERDQKRG